MYCPSAEHSAHIQEEQEKRELIKNIRQQIKSLKKMIPSSRIVLDYEPSETTDAKEEDASDEESFDVRKLQMPRFRAMVSIFLLPRYMRIRTQRAPRSREFDEWKQVKEKTGLDIPETLIGLTDATQEETDDGLICKVPITLPEQNSVDLEVRVVSSAKKQ